MACTPGVPGKSTMKILNVLSTGRSDADQCSVAAGFGKFAISGSHRAGWRGRPGSVARPQGLTKRRARDIPDTREGRPACRGASMGFGTDAPSERPWDTLSWRQRSRPCLPGFPRPGRAPPPSRSQGSEAADSGVPVTSTCPPGSSIIDQLPRWTRSGGWRFLVARIALDYAAQSLRDRETPNR